jgi:formylglycine-generating enzyme required for sulfatase activity
VHTASEPFNARAVELKAFGITRFPVTVAQFRHFISFGGYALEPYWSEGGFGRYNEPARWPEQLQQLNCPVTGISWFEAAAFCAWAEARLPSEAEWQWAAAGIERRVYPWGSEPPDNNRCSFSYRSRYLAPVGIFPSGRTPEGVLDLAGNTWEWTSDPFSQEHAADEIPGERFTSHARRMVIKGGSNVSSPAFLANSGRAWATVESRYSNFGLVGFRCARPLS